MSRCSAYDTILHNLDFATFMQTGVVSQNISTGDTDIPIKFDTPFPDNNYQVFLTHITSGNYAAVNLAVLEPHKTANGFTIHCYSTASTPIAVSWLAVRA